MKRIFKILILIVIVLGVSSNSKATLIDRGGGLIYNTDLDITWLQDANYAQTSGYDVDGRMTFFEAIAWINYLNGSNYLGYNDWRLPDTLPVNGTTYDYNFSVDGSTDVGYNNTSPNSEMSYLFYVDLGNDGYVDASNNVQTTFGIINSGPFISIRYVDPGIDDLHYWSGTDYGASSDTHAWSFSFGTGLQVADHKPGSSNYAWVVRDGDVTSVPEPATLFLLGSGLAGMVLIKRKFNC